MEQTLNSLQPGYKLHWYLIKKILGQGGFGITYLAEDTNLNRTVAIKEYMPVEFAVRTGDDSVQPVSGEHGDTYHWGLERFMNEAQTLARFKHPGIVHVLAVFQENNSAYMVMEFEHGQGLHEVLKQRKTLPEDELIAYILPILDGLEAVHKLQFIHRDIKPANIYIRDDGSSVLLDFGSARQSLKEQNRTLTSMVSPGYAPFEQYTSKSDKQGPWTDIYGLGATMYRCVTGISPVESMARSESIIHTGKDVFVTASEIAKDQYSTQFLQAIDYALAFKPEDRPQNITDWRQAFGGIINTGNQENNNYPTDAAVETENLTILPEEETMKLHRVELEDEIPVSKSDQLMDKMSQATNKAVKWGVIILIIIVILGIYENSKKNKTGTGIEADRQVIEENLIPSIDKDIVETDTGFKLPEEKIQGGDDNDTTTIETKSMEKTPQQEITKEIPSVTESSPEQVEGGPVSRIPESERQSIRDIREKIRQNPQDKTARKELKNMSKNLESKIRNAINKQDYDLAEEYIEEIMRYASTDSKKNKELQVLLDKIRARRLQVENQ